MTEVEEATQAKKDAEKAKRKADLAEKLATAKEALAQAKKALEDAKKEDRPTAQTAVELAEQLVKGAGKACRDFDKEAAEEAEVNVYVNGGSGGTGVVDSAINYGKRVFKAIC